MMFQRRCLVTILLFLVWTNRPLRAQAGAGRTGLWASAGVAGAYTDITCPGCEFAGHATSLSILARVGGTLSPHWTGSLEAVGWLKGRNGFDGRMLMVSAIALWYPWKTLGVHLDGGLGGILFREEAPGIETSANGLLTRAGVGYDIPVSRRLSVTPFLNAYLASGLNGKRNRLGFLSEVNIKSLHMGLALTHH